MAVGSQIRVLRRLERDQTSIRKKAVELLLSRFLACFNLKDGLDSFLKGFADFECFFAVCAHG